LVQLKRIASGRREKMEIHAAVVDALVTKGPPASATQVPKIVLGKTKVRKSSWVKSQRF